MTKWSIWAAACVSLAALGCGGGGDFPVAGTKNEFEVNLPKKTGRERPVVGRDDDDDDD